MKSIADNARIQPNNLTLLCHCSMTRIRSDPQWSILSIKGSGEKKNKKQKTKLTSLRNEDKP